MLLQVKGLKKHFPVSAGLFNRQSGVVKAVDGIDFAIHAGETFSLVGESGCGKSTTGRLIMRGYEPTSGSILFRDNDRMVDLAQLTKNEMHLITKNIQMVFQDPFSSLNPRMTVRDIVAEGLICHGWKDRGEIRKRVVELLDICGLNPRHASRYPHAFSGGQRQRVGVARALALNPKLIVADEPVSALDVSIQAQIVNLLLRLQKELGLTYLFISHDFGVVDRISDNVGVMYAGKLVEVSSNDELFDRPRHPYTETLLSAVPVPVPGSKLNRLSLKGEVADPSNRPSGCVFHPRCKYAQEKCKVLEPELRPIEENSSHLVACHFAEELHLQGMTLANAGTESVRTP